MEDKVLKCPSCSGQMILAEAKPGDKIAKCQYCNTIVDLPDQAEKQGFDLNDFFKGFDLKTNKSTITNISTSSTVIIKDGKVINADGDQKELMNSVYEKLKNAGISIDGLNNSNTTIVQNDIESTE